MNRFHRIVPAQVAAARFVIFDLDNCLADDEWRIPLIAWHESDIDKRYDAYHRASGADNPVNVAAFVEALGRATDRGERIALPIFFTARPAKYRDQTARWIETRLGADCYVLITRNNGDHRRSADVKRCMLDDLHHYGIEMQQVEQAFDDREDIVAMYREAGIPAEVLKWHDTCAMTPPKTQTLTVVLDAADARKALDEELDRLAERKELSQIASTIERGMREALAAVEDPPTVKTLLSMAETFRERNAVYKDNYKTAGAVLSALYARMDLQCHTPRDFELAHLVWLIVVKLTRFAHSHHSHVDSIQDIGVYAAMIATILKEQQ